MFKFGRYPLSLRFIDGEEGEGGVEDVVEQQAAEPAGNPFLDPFRSELDPISFSRVEPLLKDLDRSANERVTRSNEALAPYKEFIDNGVSPDQLKAAYSLSQQIDSSPETIYEALGNFLTENGRMPNKAELEEEVEEVEGGGVANDPRFDQLAQQQEAMREFLETQEHQRLEAAADAEVGSEVDALKAAHPDLTEADVKDIIGRAVSVAQGSGKVPALAEVHDGWFTELRTRFLSAPRPGGSAPKLLPTNGATSTSVPQKSLGALSRDEAQDLIASLIEQNR